MEATRTQRGRFRRNPLGENHHPTKRDLEWLSFIHRHGGRLPTSYIHDATSSHLANALTTSRRLKYLFHELKLIDRPLQQVETLDPRKNELIHELSDKGLKLLKEEGLYRENAPSPHGAFKHQVMLSCVSASLELNTLGTDLTFVPQHEVIQDALHMDVEGDKVAPDLVVKLVDEGKEVLLFVEVDRGTEPTDTNNMNRKSWRRSVQQYKKIIERGLYKDHYGVNCGALLLVITISPDKQQGILNVIRDEMPKGCNYILLKNIPEFGSYFRPPKVLHLLNTEWERYNNTPFKFI